MYSSQPTFCMRVCKLCNALNKSTYSGVPLLLSMFNFAASLSCSPFRLIIWICTCSQVVCGFTNIFSITNDFPFSFFTNLDCQSFLTWGILSKQELL